MRKLVFKKPTILVFGGLVFLFWINIVFASSPPPAIEYAPNFWFDSEEQYYPANPLDFYFDENMEEIPGEIAKAKYDNLSLEEKLKHFTVFYRIVDQGNEWVYQYWLFYVFNNSKYPKIFGLVNAGCYSGNEHYGDFESVFVFVDKNTRKVNRVIGSAHHGTEIKIALVNNEISKPFSKHITVLVEKGSHANYLDGDQNGLVNPEKDLNHYSRTNTNMTRSVWSEEDKKYGIKAMYNNSIYQLLPLLEFRNKFIEKYGPDKPLLAKSPTLGSFITIFGKKIYLTKLGGAPTRAAWHKDNYYNPNEMLPFESLSREEKKDFILKRMGIIKNFIARNTEKITESIKYLFSNLKGETLESVQRQKESLTIFQPTETKTLSEGPITETTFVGIHALPSTDLLDLPQETFYAPRDMGQIQIFKDTETEKEKSSEVAEFSEGAEFLQDTKIEEENQQSPEETFLVKKVIDGDTILLENGKEVRYIGIDAPEFPNGCFAKQATEKNKELVEGKKVKLVKDISETDEYGRLLRYVYIGNLFVNEYLVRNGYAYNWSYGLDTRYKEKFAEAEQEAKNNRRGLWGDVCHPVSAGPSKTGGGGSSGGSKQQSLSEEQPKEIPPIEYGEVIINEIAWMGTQADHNDEWIELYNTTSRSIDLTNSVLEAEDGSPKIVLTGIIPAAGYYLLERSDDQVISNITANQIYTGALEDAGENLYLKDSRGNMIDEVNQAEGWLAGDKEQRKSMERTLMGWHTFSGFNSNLNALDANNDPVFGTPKTENSPPKDSENVEDNSIPQTLTDTTPPEVEIFIENFNYASSSFSVHWFSPEYPSVSFEVEYKQDNEEWQELEDIEDVSNTTQTTFFIEEKDATYYFRVRAKDLADNWSDWQETSIKIDSHPIVINEIAWMGTQADHNDEWIELYNRADYDIDLNGWTIETEDEFLIIELTASISANGFYILERTDEETLSNIDADQIYTGGLSNEGEVLYLKDHIGKIIDEVNCEEGWYAGENKKEESGLWVRKSMERINPWETGSNPNNWQTYSGTETFVLDTGNNPVFGTPKLENSKSEEEPDQEQSEEGSEEGEEDEEKTEPFYTIVSQNITEDTVWTLENSPYLVYDNNGQDNELLEIAENATLTIEPGVIVKFFNPGLKVFGKIKAKGTADKPIVFTDYRDDEYGGSIFGKTNNAQSCQENPENLNCPQPGSWSGIWLYKPENFSQNQDDVSVFDNVIIRFAGSRVRPFRTGSQYSPAAVGAAIKIENTSFILKNSIIENNLFKGIWLVNSFDSSIENSVFRHHLKYDNLSQWNDEQLRNIAVYIDASSPQIQNSVFSDNITGIFISNQSRPVVEQNIFTNNFYPIWVDNSYPEFANNEMNQGKKWNGIILKNMKIDQDYVLKADSVFINYEENPKTSIYVYKDKVLTIEAGTIIKSVYATSGFKIDGTLIVNGTAEKPVVFTSIYDDEYGGDTNNDGDETEEYAKAGAWGQLDFSSTSKDSLLNYAIMRLGGTRWMASPIHFKEDYVLRIEHSDLRLTNSIVENNIGGFYLDSSNSYIAQTIFRDHRYSPPFSYFTSIGISLNSSNPVIDVSTLINNKLGIYIDANSRPTLTGLNLEGNDEDIQDLRASDESELSVQIIAIFYEGNEENEADEYVEIENYGQKDIDLTNWSLSDEAGHTYIFESYTLTAGEKIRVYTNKEDLSFGSNTPIWNNTGDTAYLRDNNGNLIDSYTY